MTLSTTILTDIIGVERLAHAQSFTMGAIGCAATVALPFAGTILCSKYHLLIKGGFH
jgi:hypothetical protein